MKETISKLCVFIIRHES